MVFPMAVYMNRSFQHNRDPIRTLADPAAAHPRSSKTTHVPEKLLVRGLHAR
jgi:hypothetical protein